MELLYDEIKQEEEALRRVTKYLANAEACQDKLLTVVNRLEWPKSISLRLEALEDCVDVQLVQTGDEPLTAEEERLCKKNFRKTFGISKITREFSAHNGQFCWRATPSLTNLFSEGIHVELWPSLCLKSDSNCEVVEVDKQVKVFKSICNNGGEDSEAGEENG